ncbi:DNA-binding MarR family transcriptional regulator [Kribbella sp. VKM Ac-2569]|uniref:MarR family winged helix-turn-helix transcriptional regulator n=1 Tax=Kribbella sp. VKM Ac-2569 TaxID=2512220 RepID=UPI00102B96A2|nr:MarR family transcriptional regulator [Kribbella sp. VKM Ac-2569]RZT12759.1 DNA-binding MarR family transcriptional regulator [Kribbella sp. VKM Ac-2569]
MEAYETAVALRRASTRLALRLRAERAGDGLGSTGVAVLGQLHRRGALTASEIAAAERVQPQSLTRVLASLEEQQLISRQQDTHDRRRHTIELTDRGRQLLKEHMKSSDDWLAEAIAERLNPTERAVLELAAGILDQLLDG